MAILRASWWRPLWFILCLSSASVHSLAGAAELLVPSEYPTITAAVEAASAGDTVLVSEGTYRENVTITTGISLKSVGGPEHTVIDGGGERRSVLTITNQSVRVVGFTLRRGEAESGGGVNVSRATVTIENCWILDNEAHDYGGGMWIESSDAVIRNSRLAGNHAVVGGGLAMDGSSRGTLEVKGTTIEDNVGWNDGGGMTLMWVRGGRLVHNIVRRNDAHYAESYGGGLSFHQSGGFLVADNLIVENTSGEGGGGIKWYSSSLVAPSLWVNNTVADNSAAFNWDMGDQLLMYGDTTGNVLANNIVAGGWPVRCQGRPDFRYNAVSGPLWGRCAETSARGTNLAVEPQFADGNPYHLAPDSPLVDAGSNRFVKQAGVRRDLDGSRRVIQGRDERKVDIGAFEYEPE